MTFRLPAVVESGTGPDRGAIEPVNPLSLPPTVMLVEDEPNLRAIVSEMCRGAGMDVIEAATAEEALRKMEDGASPDLLFTDVVLGPGRDGVSLATEARRRWPTLPILLTTGFAPQGPLPTDLPMLAKPFTRAALMKALLQARGVAAQ